MSRKLRLSGTPRHNDLRHSLGRPVDQRSLFERDRDRLLYAPAFHRLAGVTQVVLAAEGPVFHNRLTHSLKVAQIARRLAENLVRTPSQRSGTSTVEPDVAEAAGLAHDLGHPPFGHLAEEELDDYITGTMRVAEGFEGNAQSFRIVTKIGIRSVDHPGLNLTRRTLNAVLKYPWYRSSTGRRHRKFGCYRSERDDFEFARRLGPPGIEQSIEAQIMDWADDVTYAVHDLDDFYRANLIPLHVLLGPDAAPRERSRFVEWAKEAKGLSAATTKRFLDNFQSVWSYCRTGPDHPGPTAMRPFDGTLEMRAAIDRLITFLIRRYLLGTQREPIGIQRLRASLSLQVDQKLRNEVDILKSMTAFYVWNAPALVAQQEGHRKVIRTLASALDRALQPRSRNKQWGMIPEPFRCPPNPNPSQRARLVADIIVSMTEQQALLMYQRLTGSSPGSVRDVILY